MKTLFQSTFNESAILQHFGRFFSAAGCKVNFRSRPEAADVSGAKDCLYHGGITTADNKRVGVFSLAIDDGRVFRRRVGLRNLVKPFTHPDYGTHDAVFAIFHDATGAWRFSYICDLAGGETAAKRYTYVFGDARESYRTPYERFEKLAAGPVTLEAIREAFSVEALTKEFFKDYTEIYLKFRDYAIAHKNDPDCFEFGSFSEKEIRDYVKLTLGRIVFLCFLQKKGWMGCDANWHNGNTNFLGNLFETYCKTTSRFAFLDDVLEPLFFDCLNTDRPEALFDTCVPGIGKVRIPYLNGGLFEKKPIDEPKSVFPRELWKSLFNLFARFNFTIVENDPTDAEIGVDPEMLGKIFESQLEDNNDKGAFYTPKEIVSYMCKESIKAYLTKETKPPASLEIDNFVSTHIVPDTWDSTMRAAVAAALREVKICDPAIGSGAFPMGLLSELCALRSELEDAARSPAELKREILSRNIYGVDIERGAIDIARLRFWLALVVDEDIPSPLPNLDFKIMQGNSLLESYEGHDLSQMAAPKKKYIQGEDLFGRKQYFQAELIATDDDLKKHELITLKEEYFSCSDHARKAELMRRINDNIRERTSHLGVDFGNLDVSANDQFFLWHTWFGEVFQPATDCDTSTGFDIVIGNPPYISAPTQLASPQLTAQRQAIVATKNYQTLYQKWDLYIPFMERGLKLLSKGGHFAMIVPYPLSNQLYGKVFREWVLKNYAVTEITDLNGTKIFENATVSNLILFASATAPTNKIKISHISGTKKIAVDFDQDIADLVQDKKTIVWNLTQEKRETNRHADFHVLGDYCYISVGMVLNADEKTAKGEFSKEDLISETKDEIHCREYVEGKSIERYFFNHRMFLEYGTPRVPNKLRRPTFPELYDRSKLLTNQLGAIKVAFDSAGDLTTNHTCRMLILWKDLHGVENKSISSSIKKFNTLSRQEMEVLSKSVSLKYLLGLLNSDYIKSLLEIIRSGDICIYPEHIRNIPIPPATAAQQAEIVELVDQILAAKKADPAADTSALESQIDNVVYTLYGLTKEEIAIIEKRD